MFQVAMANMPAALGSPRRLFQSGLAGWGGQMTEKIEGIPFGRVASTLMALTTGGHGRSLVMDWETSANDRG